MIYNLLIVLSSPPIDNSRIDHFTDSLKDVKNIDKICD